MSWQESRGDATVTAGVRRSVHSDDAKSRSDDLSSLRGSSLRVRARPRWLVPAGVATVVVLLGGGAAAAVMGSGDSPAEADGGTPAAASGSTAGPTPATATTAPAAVTTPTASTSPSGPAAGGSDPLYFTTTGQMVVTQAGRGPQTYRATYRIDCRSGPCSIVNPITKTTVVMPSTAPDTWSLPAQPLPTDACNTPGLGDPNFPRGAATMTLTPTSVRTVSSFAGFTLRGGGCYAYAAGWTSVYTGDRKPL